MSGQRVQLSSREAALKVAERLREHGHLCYFAGGCVRDQLLGIEPDDYDIATDAVPERVLQIFPRARGVGAAFGVVLVDIDGRAIEVATFRTDGHYADSRHPSEVHVGTPEEDAQRRDFTINGLFEDPQSGEVIDFVNGRSDLEAGLLKAIGDPEHRFEEDHLRMIRAVRFASRFDFQIDSATERAIVARATRLEGVSRERIGHEMRRMFAHPNRCAAARLLQRMGLNSAVFSADFGDSSSIQRLAAMPPESVWIDALAAWILDQDTSLDPREIARLMAKNLVLSNHERDDLLDLLKIRSSLVHQWDGLEVAARKRLASGSLYSRASVLLKAEDPILAARIEDELAPLIVEGLSPPRLVGGEDLLASAIAEGPLLGRLLEQIYDAQLEGRIATFEEAMALARTLADES